MKQVFKCDYCNFMGTYEEVKEHEPKCMDNYDRKSCYTCLHKGYNGLKGFKCDAGIEIPEGQLYEFCKSYERVIRLNAESKITDLFGGLFGGI